MSVSKTEELGEVPGSPAKYILEGNKMTNFFIPAGVIYFASALIYAGFGDYFNLKFRKFFDLLLKIYGCVLVFGVIFYYLILPLV